VLLSYNLTATVHFPTRVQNRSNMAIVNTFIDNYKFTKYSVSPVYNGLSTNSHLSYSIRNINKYSVEEFKIRLSYESWDSIFSNNDNMDVDLLFNIS
jgi:hypothetical protein